MGHYPRLFEDQFTDEEIVRNPPHKESVRRDKRNRIQF